MSFILLIWIFKSQVKEDHVPHHLPASLIVVLSNLLLILTLLQKLIDLKLRLDLAMVCSGAEHEI